MWGVGSSEETSSFLPPLPLMPTLDCNFSPSFLYFLKSVVVTVENTEPSLARKIVHFEVSLGTGSVFYRIALWDFATVLPHLLLQLGNGRNSDPKQSHSTMRHNTDPVSRGSWPIHLYRRLTGPRVKRRAVAWYKNHLAGWQTMQWELEKKDDVISVFLTPLKSA